MWLGWGGRGSGHLGCSWTDVYRSPAWQPKLGSPAKLLVKELETGAAEGGGAGTREGLSVVPCSVWSLSMASSSSVLGGQLLVTVEA